MLNCDMALCTIVYCRSKLACYGGNAVFLCSVHVTVLRTLTGHKASVRSMDFHPYGDYVATGSLDTNIKVRITVV